MLVVLDDIPIDVPVRDLIVAGWTGRDPEAVRHHVEELAAIGVAPPSTVPLYYRAARSLLTRETTIDVLGPNSSGEVEPVLVNHDGRLLLGLGSDHTDRALEAVSVAASKQLCPKPVARDFWHLEAVAGHLDALELRCEIEEAGTWTLYQDGTLAALRPLGALAEGAGLATGQVMFCGTLGAIGGVRPAQRYRMALRDPVLNRTIALHYTVKVLPVIA